ncbi:MAG TPA: phage baseplate assembly protein V [Thermoanaerobaculia bacterium]|nr:phage baseplate assembly protein V [Thermoanaerobaculia bacterium]
MDPAVLDLIASRREPDRLYGVVVGVVTNNQDPDGLGRVKVRFPWLSEEHESSWARVAAPMAGNDRGFYTLPEVDDEVLVAFEHGRVELPYVLGALWNGKDKPPADNGDGENNIRVFKSRSGHVIRLDDTDGAEKIEIADADGKQSLVFDTAANTITLTAEKDVVIESKDGMVKLTGKKGVEITAPDGKGKLEANSGLEIKSPSGNVDVKGTTINLN